MEIKGTIRITGICGDKGCNKDHWDMWRQTVQKGSLGYVEIKGTIRITGICGDKGYNKDHWDMWR